MRLRKKSLGSRNLIGIKIKKLRKEKKMKQRELISLLEVYGIELNSSALSKLEGQFRSVSDIELVALAKIFDVSVEYLVGNYKKSA